jgi:phosphoglycerate dehydrogenase-like enzyme
VRWVQSTWAGVKPLLELPRRDYLLTGVKDVFGPQMAEYVFGHLLAREIRLAERRERQRRREWWQAESGTLEGKRMGIMGTGSIGRHIARAAAAFDLRVCGYSRSGRPAPGFAQVYPAGQLTDFLAQLDYLVCVLPDTPDTQDLLDDAAFRTIGPGCVLINIGRGSLIDERALLAALDRGDLAAAVLDVFEEEPLPAASPLWNAPRVTVTAHVSGISRPVQIARLFEANYTRWAAGETPHFVVDFEQGY